MSDNEYDYDDDQLEASDEEDIDDMIYSETCANDDSEESEINIIDEIINYDQELEINKKSKQKNKNKYFMGKCIDMNKITIAKDDYLYNIKYNELLAIILNYTNILQKGGLPLIDEVAFKDKYNLELFNNEALTPETLTMIMMIIMNIPICVKKYSKIYNREAHDINELPNEYIICYYYNIKNMLRSVTYNTNNKYNFDIFMLLFPKFIQNINFDFITTEELSEIIDVKKTLSNYENL
ncbi:RNA polymerase RPO19 [Adoxophyes honmai entomopoxvirus 'L']|uniref:RNA polymerase RPO19 n=1 Tax=Adoxophyes honmai entomopoxvirus 'L' TaxID=1293540 RepID=A0A916KP87_9POXV|nr:RNA polymerase RPO19 [Adoxophyes honmai entomopoxvirus 'L']CCU55489.1 RNA polymerase RPO19 [Adoxophyes honmai entomopoxvirus 'L']